MLQEIPWVSRVAVTFILAFLASPQGLFGLELRDAGSSLARKESPGIPPSVLEGATIPWRHSLEEAFTEATRLARPLLVDFGAEWCGWCKKLDRETFGHDEVIKFVSEHFVAVKVDVERDPSNARKYGVSGLPTVLFLDSRGQEFGRVDGFRDSKVFLAEAKKAVTSASSLEKIRTEAEEKPDDPDAQRTYARALFAGGNPDEAEKRLQEALRKSPDHSGLLLDIADMQRLKGQYREAVDLYFKVLSSKEEQEREDTERALVPLARCLLSLGKLTEAEKVLNDHFPNDSRTESSEPPTGKNAPHVLEALFLRGYVRAVLGRVQEALSDLRAARETDPEGPWGQRAGFILQRLEP